MSRGKIDKRVGDVVHCVRPCENVRERMRVVYAGLEETETADELETEDEAEKRRRRMQKMADPEKPCAEKVEEHEKVHLPYRSWCRHCVRGRCKNVAHKKGKDEAIGHELHMDFGFIGKEREPGKTATVLVTRERKTKMTLATLVPSKSTGTFVANRLMAFLKEIGLEFGDLVVKTDQEAAMGAIVENLRKNRAAAGGGAFIVEQSPVGASQSNGVVERGIQAVVGQVRVLLDALETRWGVDIPTAHPVLTWQVEHAALTLNRFEVGHDGRTPYERCKKKKAKMLGIEFGEAIFWRRKREGGAMAKLSSTWEDGVYLGVRGRSGEIIVADGKGVWKTRSVQRKPIGDRWDARSADLVKDVPWRCREEDPNEDGEKPEVIKLSTEQVKAERETVETTATRRVRIDKKDFEEHGYSARCPGCLAMLRGTTRQSHSQECRNRMEKNIDGTQKAETAKRKLDEFLGDALEKEDRNRARKERNLKEEATRDEEPRPHPTTDGSAAQASSSWESTGVKRSGDDQEEERRPKKAMVGNVEVNQEEEFDWEDADDKMYCDDRNGEFLDAGLVAKAEKEEIQFMQDFGVGEECDVQDCWNNTGKPPISTKLVRVNKGSAAQPDVRARLCARDFKPKGDSGRCDLFAAMPPLEAKKLLFRMAALGRRQWRRGRWRKQKIMLIDVTKAHLNGRVPEDIHAYVELPDGTCWRLKRWLYGMRPAASYWEADYAERMEAVGFIRGKAAPTVFHNPRTGVRCVVHGDDFTFTGCDIDLADMAKEMKSWYELKVRALVGDEDGDDHEATILNRTIRWSHGVFEYEADPKHVKILMEELGLNVESKGLEAPAERMDVEKGWSPEDDDESELMDSSDARKFRSIAARMNYLAMDRADIQFAAKEVCRSMAKPKIKDWGKVKRLARYLVEVPRLVWRFAENEGQNDKMQIDVYTDSDWAGDKESRKSTSGGLICVAGGTCKSWAGTQSTIAASSGEAEYYSLIKGAAEGLGFQALAKDLGFDMNIFVWVDASAAKAIVSRIGLGKVRHMEVKYLWAQEAHRDERFRIRKVAGAKNPSDVLTKPMGYNDMVDKLELVGGQMEKRRKSTRISSRGGRQRWADIPLEGDDEESGSEEQKTED